MRVSILLLALSLSACADYRPSSNPAVERECRYEAEKATASIYNALEKVWTMQDIMAACRKYKG